jgi:hypothetical protein
MVITVVVPIIKQGATVTRVSAVVDLVVPFVVGVAASAAFTASRSQILPIKN